MQWIARVAICSITVTFLMLSSSAIAQPHDPHAQRGMQAIFANDTDTAIQEFEMALKTNPDDLTLLKGLANLQLWRFWRDRSETAALDAANRYLQRALQLDAEDAEVLNMVAAIHAESGDYAKAEAIYLRLADRPDIPKGQYSGNLGDVYLRWGKYDLAEAKLKEAIARGGHPLEVVDAYQNLGELYEETDRAQEATQVYQRAIDFAKGVPGDLSKIIDELRAKLKRQGDSHN